jgi:hypothetical protein
MRWTSVIRSLNKRILLLALVLAIAPAVASQVAQTPGFTTRSGAQGFGYYAVPAARPAQVQTANRPRSVGPGTRNFSTGNRVGLHRPWMRARS